MKRVLTAVLILTMATPVLALDNDISGSLKVRAFMRDQSALVLTNLGKPDKTNDDPERFYESRFRARWLGTVNEYVSVVYYGEVDFDWGDESYSDSGRNDGGALGGDTTNLETKNVYMDVKVPDTSVSARIGLQPVIDHWNGLLVLADAAGAKVDFKAGPIGASVMHFKWQEGGNADEDDIDFSGLTTSIAPMKNLKLGLDGYWLNINGVGSVGAISNFSLYDTILSFRDVDGASKVITTNGDLFYLGVNGNYKSDPIAAKFWAVYNFGAADQDFSGTDPGTGENFTRSKKIDVSAFALSGQIEHSLSASTKLSLWGLFFSSDDDIKDGRVTYFTTPTMRVDNSFMSAPGFGLFLSDKFDTNVTGPSFGEKIAMSPFGLWAVAATGSYVPAAKDVYVNGGVGYFSAVEDTINGEKVVEGTGLGTELYIRAGIKIAKAFDISINGFYAVLGDFLDNTRVNDDGGPADPENPYIVYMMANVAF